jgi:hopene-associated glycosyltransferase HpnB
LAIWVYLVFLRGAFWRVQSFDDDKHSVGALNAWPSVVAVVPARNEAETIAQTVSSLVQQDYPGKFSVVVVDDHSTDGTATLALQAAALAVAADRVAVHSAAELPAGWTGKLWALNEGVRSAGLALAQREPLEFFWFTDADIVHAPDTLTRLVSRAQSESLDLTSLMVLLQARTLPERLLIPPFLYFFLMLYPPRWIAYAKARTAGAAGGCILLRRSALEAIGGLAAIRGEVIDDCALALAVKNTGAKIWMGLTRESVSLRSYGSFHEIRDMIARTAFTQLRYSGLLLMGTLAGMLLTYVVPVALLFVNNLPARMLSLVTWLLMSVSFLPTVRFYQLSLFWAPFLPVAAAFYSYATWLSAARFWLGRGGQWKGRSQTPKSS